jgi:hypothetical protein
MLAGTYTVQLQATVGSVTTTKTLKDISVYSIQPTVKVTGVSPGTSTQFDMNPTTGESDYTEVKSSLQKVQNYYSDYRANVYIATEDWEQVIDDETTDHKVQYSLPSVTLTLSNAGSFASAKAVVANAASSSYNKTYTFTSSALTQTSEIGGIEQKSQQASSTSGCTSSETVYVYWHEQYNAGTQVISTITMYDSKDTAYTMQLSDSVTIHEENVAPPSISYTAETGYTSFQAVESEDGDSITITLPTAEQFGTQTATVSEIVNGNGWELVETSSDKYCYVTAETKTNPVTSGGCNSTTTNYIYGIFTYHQYIRYQYKYEQTAGTKFYSVTKGLTGWKIGDTVYQPGETITVSSAVTAVPVIGELSKTFLREEVVTTVHTTYKDVANGTSTSTGDKTSTKTEADAKKKYTLPSGYSWFNSSDPYDSSAVTTTETQIGSDYTK